MIKMLIPLHVYFLKTGLSVADQKRNIDWFGNNCCYVKDCRSLTISMMHKIDDFFSKT